MISFRLYFQNIFIDDLYSMLSLCNASKMFSNVCKCLRIAKVDHWTRCVTFDTQEFLSASECVPEILHYILQIVKALCTWVHVWVCLYVYTRE